MAIEVKNTKSFANHGIKILVYGPAGSGKTRLIKTLTNPIVLSAEAGLLSLSGEDIPYIEVHNMADLEEAYKFIKEHIDEYGCVVLDSISEIAEVVLAAEKEKNKDGRQAYGALLDTMKAMVRAFRDLPTNIYFSAQMEKQQDDTGRIFYGPGAPGTKVSQMLPYLFDEILTLRVEPNQEGKLERWLQTFRDAVYEAKDRSGKLDAFEKPDLGAIIAKISG